LRPRRIAIAKLDAERVADGLLLSGLDLARDARISLSDLELARDRNRLLKEAVLVRERIAEITRARQRAGEASQLDTAAAEAEAARARDEAERVVEDIGIAYQRLLFLIGLGNTNIVFSPLPPTPDLTVSLPDLEKRALAARPDLRASELAVEAAAKRVGLATAEILVVSGIIDANGSGKEGFEIGPGALLTIPIFNQNQAARTRAAADLERAAWNCVGTQRRIRLEVREAYAKHEQASKALRRWSAELLPSLEELVRNSEKAYELGELSPLTVQDNVRQLLTARVREAEIRADLRRARAELERSVGMRLEANNK
jgi:cobalt-zinc-cadmium efflux system outer membrane protein